MSDFSQLAAFAAISRVGMYISTCGALIVMRRRPGAQEAFQAPGGPALAVVGIVFCLWLLTTRSLAEAWLIPAIVVSAMAVWFASRNARHAARV